MLSVTDPAPNLSSDGWPSRAASPLGLHLPLPWLGTEEYVWVSMRLSGGNGSTGFLRCLREVAEGNAYLMSFWMVVNLRFSWRISSSHIHIFLSHTPSHQPSSLFSVSQVEIQWRPKKTPRLLDTPRMSSQSNGGLQPGLRTGSIMSSSWEQVSFYQFYVYTFILVTCLFCFFTCVFLMSSRIWVSRSLSYICNICRGGGPS